MMMTALVKLIVGFFISILTLATPPNIAKQAREKEERSTCQHHQQLLTWIGSTKIERYGI